MFGKLKEELRIAVMHIRHVLLLTIVLIQFHDKLLRVAINAVTQHA